MSFAAFIAALNGTGTGEVPGGGTGYYLTAEGAVNDADLALNANPTGKTNNTSAIQDVLDLGGDPDNPITVYVDGKFAVTQLKVKPYTTIIGTSSSNGFIQFDNTNKPLLVNYNRSTSISDSSITLQNFTLNVNGYRAGGYRQTKVGSEGINVGLRLAGVQDITVDGVRILNSAAFASFVTKFNNVTWNNVYVEAQDLQNQDGCKFLVGTGLTVNNLSGKNMGDDTLSICANDAIWPTDPPPDPGGGQTYFDPYAVYGTIDYVNVDGVNFDQCRYGIRLLSGDQLVSNITINNVFGSAKGMWFIMDNYQEAPENLYGAGGEGSIINTGHFSNILLDGVDVIIVESSTYKPAYATIGYCECDVFTLNNYNRVALDSAIDYPTLDVWGNVETLNASDWTITRTDESSNDRGIRMAATTASIETLNLTNITTHHLKNVVENYHGTITTIIGSNVNHLDVADGYGMFYIRNDKVIDTIDLSDGFTNDSDTMVEGGGLVTTKIGWS